MDKDLKEVVHLLLEGKHDDKYRNFLQEQKTKESNNMFYDSSEDEDYDEDTDA